MKGKIALVTGATRGIGKEILYTFARAGAQVYGTYKTSRQAAEQIAREMREEGLRATLYQGDVMERYAVQNVVQDIIKQCGKIDILLNNAGMIRDNIIFNLGLDEWQAVFGTNFCGTYNCCEAVVPYMLEQKRGHIINIVSVTGVFGREGQSNYGASKGAVMGLTRMLSRLYSTQGIYCNCIAPGMTETDMIRQAPQDKIDNYLRYTHTKKIGTASEIAEIALFLAEERSSYLINTVLKADGGFMR